ncbi:retrotransposable element Tf2 [Tanacetum coccineum]
MMTTPVLALPYFEKEFVVETDDSYCGIGVVLHQDGHPIAYLTKALSPAHQSLSTYEKEFLAVIIGLDSYGQPLPTYVPNVSGDSYVEVVDRTMQFDVGMWVYVKLQPHKHVTIRKASYNKLSSKYYGPFQIIKKVGQVAYELELLTSSEIHNVFHVSQLKKCTRPIVTSGTLPKRVADQDTSGYFERKIRHQAEFEHVRGGQPHKALNFIGAP